MSRFATFSAKAFFYSFSASQPEKIQQFPQSRQASSSTPSAAMPRYRTLQFRMPIRDPTISYQRFLEEWPLPPPAQPPAPHGQLRSSSPMIISDTDSSVSNITTPPSSEDESVGVIFGRGRRKRRTRRRKTNVAAQVEEVEEGMGMLPLTEESKKIHESGMYYHGPAPRQEGRRRGRPRIGECVGFVEHPLGLTQKDVERVRRGIKPSTSSISTRKNRKGKKKDISAEIVSRSGSRRVDQYDDDDDDTDEEYQWDTGLCRKSTGREPTSKSSPVRAVAKRRKTMKDREELKRRNSLPAIIPATDSSSEGLSSIGPPRKVARLDEDVDYGFDLGGLEVERVVPDSAGEEDSTEEQEGEDEEFVMASQPSTADEIHVRSFSRSPLPPSPSTLRTTTQYSSALGNLPSPTYITAMRSLDNQTGNSGQPARSSSPSEEEADSSVEVHESMTLPEISKPATVDDEDDMEDSIVVKDSFSYPNNSVQVGSGNSIRLQTPSSQKKNARAQGSSSMSKLSQSSITASWRGLKSSKVVVSSVTSEKDLRNSRSGGKLPSSGHSATTRHYPVPQKPSSMPMSSTTTLRAITQVPQPSQSQEVATGGKAPLSDTTRSRSSVISSRRDGSIGVNQEDDEDAPPCSQQTPVYHRPTQHVFTIGENSSEEEAEVAASPFSSTLR